MKCLIDDVYFRLTVTRVDTHSHPSNRSVIKRGLVLKRVYQQVATDPTVPVRRVFDKVVNEDSSDSDVQPSWEGIRSRAKRVRKSFVPPIPRNINDVRVEDDWAQTWKRRRFLRHLDNNNGIAVFFTKKMITAMQKADTLFIDGTFRTTPAPYVQFVSVHGLYYGHVIPMAFCLLNGKTEQQYRIFLQVLKDETRAVTGRPLHPSQMVLDFEQATMQALKAELPTTLLSGCYFHYTKSLWRHVQHLGLCDEYHQNRRVRKIIRKVMAIGFLPLLLVRQNFNLLKGSRRTQRQMQRIPVLTQWFDYVETTYVARNATFPPRMWNVYERSMETRTNNHVEGNNLSCNRIDNYYFRTAP